MTKTIIETCKREAQKSTCVMRLGACIVKGKRIIYSAHNDKMRTTYMNKLNCSIHAELNVARKFLNCFPQIKVAKY